MNQLQYSSSPILLIFFYFSKKSFILESWETLLQLLSHSELRKRFLLLTIPFFFVGMSAYGIHFSVKLVDFDIFTINIIKEIAIIITILSLIPIYIKVRKMSDPVRGYPFAAWFFIIMGLL